MPRSAPSLLSRLRRHRGLWVLAVAMLLIKLAAATICLTDGPGKRVATQATTISASTSATMTTASVDALADNAGDCLLGEGGDCHCACAHTMPMPATAPPPIARMDAHFDSPAIHSGFALATIGSLLRPPIA